MTYIYTISNIAEKLNARSLINIDSEIEMLATDSRKVVFPNSTLFFALTDKRDGHKYIQDLIAKGVKNFVVSEIKWLDAGYKNINFILVDNTLTALQNLITYHRQRFEYPVFGITGSNGKTIVKEWLFQLLSSDYVIVRSPKSYNSQIGVPLSVWGMHPNAELAFFEAGISQSGEMGVLERIIKPTVGVLTNIGTTHDEGFSSRTFKIKEKLKLFDNVGMIIYNKDDLKGIEHPNLNKPSFTWSFTDASADLFVEKVDVYSKKTIIYAKIKNQYYSIEIPFIDKASISNAVTCWCVLLFLNIPHKTTLARIRELSAIDMRLKIISGINQCVLINDSYNSDIKSLEIALNLLTHQGHTHKTVILSDLLQAGIPDNELYALINRMLESVGVTHFIGIGKKISAQSNLFKIQSVFYDDINSFVSEYEPNMFRNESILIKGARVYGFERISKLLELKLHDTIFEINLNALVQNLNYYRSLVRPGTKIMAMVKASSYGSGSVEIASTLQFNRVDYLAVAYVDEGIELRKGGIKLPIMVMNPEVNAFGKLIQYNLEPELYSFRIFNEFIHYLTSLNIKDYPVHIKIDTGMHRLGFEEKNIVKLSKLLSNSPEIKVISVFSHLVSSEDKSDDSFTIKQQEIFNYASKTLEDNIGYSFIKHICNTAGIARHPNSHLDMVRIGLGLYGIDSVSKNNRLLQPIGTLKTCISQIKELQVDETIGYNRAGKVYRVSKIATVKLGYADGLNRKLSNGVGEMLINGKRVPIVGKVCMDMTMLDVTDIDCKETDDVIVFNDELRVEEIAEKLGTIPYEILTTISQRVKRVYVHE